MSIFSRLRSNRNDPQHFRLPEGIPAPDQKRDLILYTNPGCPFCRRVTRNIDELGLEEMVQYANTSRDRAASARLREVTGRSTVPCLFIDDVPFFESSDINAWLSKYATLENTA